MTPTTSHDPDPPRHARRHRLAAVLAAALVAPAAGAAAQDAAAVRSVDRLPAHRVLQAVPAAPGGWAAPEGRVQRQFALGGSPGRELVELTVQNPGRVRAEATWSGSAAELSMILVGPGVPRIHLRRQGPSPLRLDYEVTAEMLALGDGWGIALSRVSGTGSATGELTVVYPKAFEVLGDPPSPPTAQPERSILPDGKVQVRYPDGRVVVYETSCGWTTTFPDGTTSHVACSQVQTASLPGTPTDAALATFLGDHNDRLLGHISRLVGNDQPQVDLYLAFEGQEADSIYKQIKLRTELIGKLLAQ
jgi:hypothetical protein